MIYTCNSLYITNLYKYMHSLATSQHNLSGHERSGETIYVDTNAHPHGIMFVHKSGINGLVKFIKIGRCHRKICPQENMSQGHIFLFYWTIYLGKCPARQEYLSYFRKTSSYAAGTCNDGRVYFSERTRQTTLDQKTKCWVRPDQMRSQIISCNRVL